MNKKIFLLNGPPRCGKDTAASYLAMVTHSGIVMKFAEPLKDGCCAVFCRNKRELFNSFDTPEMKDEPHNQFLGLSCRQAQIDMSEKYLKVIYGQEVFGKILAEKIDKTLFSAIFVSDSGFEPEAKVLVDKFGAENVIVIRIHREGHTYNGDSRNYIGDIGQCATYDITNTDLGQYYKEMQSIIAKHIGA